MKQGPDIGRVEVVPRLGFAQEANDIVMCDDHALGFSGRARSVNNVSGVVAGNAGLRGIGRFPGYCGPIGIQAQQSGCLSREFGAQARFRNEEERLRILQHKAQAVGRVGQVDRHVDSPGFENRQDGNNHPGGALEVKRHRGFGLYTQSCEVIGQFVGLLVKFPIAQLLFMKTHRHPVGRLASLRLEHLVDTARQFGFSFPRRGFGKDNSSGHKSPRDAGNGPGFRL